MPSICKVLTVLTLAFVTAFIVLRLIDWPPALGFTTLCLIVAIFTGGGAFAARHMKP